MKNLITAVFFCLSLTLLTHTSKAQQSGIGLGAILNSPNGLSIKGWVSDDLAIDGAISFSLSENFQSLYLHSDVLYHNDSLNEELELNNASLRTYYGAGIRLLFNDFNNGIGIRLPLGITYSLTNAPLGAFFELVPVFDIEPSFQFLFTGGIGLRYYIN